MVFDGGIFVDGKYHFEFIASPDVMFMIDSQ